MEMLRFYYQPFHPSNVSSPFKDSLSVRDLHINYEYDIMFFNQRFEPYVQIPSQDLKTLFGSKLADVYTQLCNLAAHKTSFSQADWQNILAEMKGLQTVHSLRSWNPGRVIKLRPEKDADVLKEMQLFSHLQASSVSDEEEVAK